MKNFVLIILGLVLSINVFAQDDKENVFVIVEDMPVYPGGEEALRNDIATLKRMEFMEKFTLLSL
jgi:hypothetical protein